MSDLLLQVRFYFVILGKPLLLQLGVDEVSIHRDFEPSSARRNERERLDVLLEVLQQLFRQTDGFLFVASLGTVFDLYLHEESPF